MNIKKKIRDYFNKCSLLSRGYKLFTIILLAPGIMACDDNTLSEPAPDSTFSIHIGEDNIAEIETNAPEYYPPMYKAVLVMEDLPTDEKIIYMGSVHSTENPKPDLSDKTYISDCSNDELFQNWDWKKEPLYIECLHLFHPLPGTTYYVRGYVQTDKAEYYSNTIEIRSKVTAPMEENPDAYEIPVIFHLFPDTAGNYPFKEWMVKEQLDYANHVYGNYYNIPGQTETGVRFVAATHTPDGTQLETPGIIYEKEAVDLDYQNPQMDDKYIWDMEYALNVWVCPFKNIPEMYGGLTMPPVFDADEMLEGCATLSAADSFTGIFLNQDASHTSNIQVTFAHEAGHFLGLLHIFEQGGDFCDDTPWYDYEAYRRMQDYYNFRRFSETGEEFWSDNIMDYEYSFMTGFTPDQKKRIQYTLQHAYFIPGEAGKKAPVVRSIGQPRHLSRNRLIW